MRQGGISKDWFQETFMRYGVTEGTFRQVWEKDNNTVLLYRSSETKLVKVKVSSEWQYLMISIWKIWSQTITMPMGVLNTIYNGVICMHSFIWVILHSIYPKLINTEPIVKKFIHTGIVSVNFYRWCFWTCPQRFYYYWYIFLLLFVSVNLSYFVLVTSHVFLGCLTCWYLSSSLSVLIFDHPPHARTLTCFVLPIIYIN